MGFRILEYKPRVTNFLARGRIENEPPNCMRASKTKTVPTTSRPVPSMRCGFHRPGQSAAQMAKPESPALGSPGTNRTSDCSCLLDQSLAHAVNEIGVGRHRTRLPNIAGNLSSMIGGVHEHVGQDVTDQTFVGFTLAVLVCDGSIEQVRGVVGEIFSP